AALPGLSAEESRGLGARGQFPCTSHRASVPTGTVTPRPGQSRKPFVVQPLHPGGESLCQRATVPRVFTPAPGKAAARPTPREENPALPTVGRCATHTRLRTCVNGRCGT